MEILNENLKQIKVPTSSDNIYSEECVFSYDTPVNSLIKLIVKNFANFIVLISRKVMMDYT